MTTTGLVVFSACASASRIRLYGIVCRQFNTISAPDETHVMSYRVLTRVPVSNGFNDNINHYSMACAVQIIHGVTKYLKIRLFHDKLLQYYFLETNLTSDVR